MDERRRTAFISMCLNIVLTTLKFILFGITGSLAILAEAWHSVSDIGTSLLVFLTIRRPSTIEAADVVTPDSVGRSDAVNRDSPPAEAGHIETGQQKKPVSRWVLFLRQTSAEYFAATAIGVFLSIVAISLLVKVARWQAQPLERPLLAGLLFLLFALGSYFVSRYETTVGRSTGSVGLISDGVHAKADMVGSLLVGISLILFSLGLNVDRLVALMISLFVLSFAIETLVNTVISRLRGTSGDLSNLRTLTLVAMACDREHIEQTAVYLEKLTGWRFISGLQSTRKWGRYLRVPVGGLLILIWLSTCFYTVGTSEQAIVERFGRPLNLEKPLSPGLHIKYPWPIDLLYRRESLRVQNLSVGNLPDENTFALLWTRVHGTEEAFLTGDNNFFFPYIVIHYRIGNLLDYRIYHASAESLLENLVLSHATKLFASRSFSDLVGSERGKLETQMQTAVQIELEQLQTGIEILGIHFRDMHPPISIAVSFEEVIAAKQELQLSINRALGYRNKLLPETRGKASRMLSDAETYVQDRTLRSEGDASRFLSRLERDSATRKLTMSRLHFNTLIDVASKADIILVDPSAGVPTVFFDKSPAAMWQSEPEWR